LIVAVYSFPRPLPLPMLDPFAQDDVALNDAEDQVDGNFNEAKHQPPGNDLPKKPSFIEKRKKSWKKVTNGDIAGVNGNWKQIKALGKIGVVDIVTAPLQPFMEAGSRIAEVYNKDKAVGAKMKAKKIVKGVGKGLYGFGYGTGTGVFNVLKGSAKIVSTPFAALQSKPNKIQQHRISQGVINSKAERKKNYYHDPSRTFKIIQYRI